MEQKNQRVVDTEMSDGRSPLDAQQLAFAFAETGEAPVPQGGGTQALTPPPEEGALARMRSARTGSAQSLMEAVVAQENMRAAHRKVLANKGSPGIDGMTVEELPDYIRKEWPRLRKELLEGRYRPQPVKRVEIPKPDGGVRELGVPTVVDRLIQQAVLQILTPIYDPTFSPHSYGFRPGKSAHQALLQAREYVAEGKEWVVDLDLEKFFDRVNHDVLIGRLTKRIGDRRVIRLIRSFLTVGILADGVIVGRTEGTPQGGPLSPLLANILLDDLDKELETRGHCFCRYADDCNIYVQSERAGERVMASVTRFLEKRLRLKVNTAKSAVGKPSARTFLGYLVGRRGKTACLRVAPESRQRAKDAIRRITSRSRGVSMPQMLRELRTFTDGWVAYYCKAPWRSLFVGLDQWIRRRIRCFQWKQWRTPANRARHLRKAGVEEHLAWSLAYAGPRWWWLSNCQSTKQALSNGLLARMGFSSLVRRYDAMVSE